MNFLKSRITGLSIGLLAVALIESNEKISGSIYLTGLIVGIAMVTPLLIKIKLFMERVHNGYK